MLAVLNSKLSAILFSSDTSLALLEVISLDRTSVGRLSVGSWPGVRIGG